ncbi:hypothetical protein AC579_530 [Pseudocercospora musae]|uniref:Clp ATPase C-terminal domain-containing protein n=1 Tax=Pseudocercospora musae TaxID=113226 RepID=A0A139IRG3_9PEZI|nr:hypothetical protein AC579_530 [Pseudocercospora musae]
MATLASTYLPRARLFYLGISAIVRRHLSSSHRSLDSGSYIRSDFTTQPFTGIYEPGGPTEGPLRDASNIGAPRITPTILKDHLDQFVVGQERAKKTLATAVYNHYQRIQELQRRDEEEQEEAAAEERRRMAQNPRHPVEDEFPGQQQTTIHVYPPNTNHHRRPSRHNGPGPPPPLHDPTPLNVEKSNVLLLGPSGVGKTLMAKTLARVLEVPFSMSDCTPFTQAGYIGEDAEVCVQRLLAAANYDVTRAERGIICLDEIDKIATAKVSHGKDVSGEGVQQALLKIIEGTTLQVHAKQERGSESPRRGQGSGYPTNSPLSGGNMRDQSGGGKGEVYNVKTDNILFICAGAFNGLHKMILDRISKGSIGFGATVRAAPGTSESNAHETVMEGEDELFEKHLPYYQRPASAEDEYSDKSKKRSYNILDLLEPQDLQKYGLIPELVGRIPISCALSSLSIDALVKVLTEPRNSLLKQYQQLFALSSIELRFTTPALHTIATTASKTGTGARGLRTVMERLLADAMFETPGSGIKYVLINEDVAERKSGAVYFARGQQTQFRNMIAEEEEAWEEKKRREEGASESEFEARARNNSIGGAAKTFEEYREKATAAGFV